MRHCIPKHRPHRLILVLRSLAIRFHFTGHLVTSAAYQELAKLDQSEKVIECFAVRVPLPRSRIRAHRAPYLGGTTP